MNPTQQKPTLVFEMLDRVAREPNFAARAVKLREFAGRELNVVLQINYHPAVRLELPSGCPTFQRDNGDPDMAMSRTRNIIPDLLELRVENKKITPEEKQRRFVGILESLNEREAEVFILAKDRKLQDRWPALNLSMIQQAIPGIV